MRRVPWYQEAIWNVIAPPQKLASFFSDGVKGFWHKYVALVSVQAERDELVKGLAVLEGKLVRLSEVEQENARLRALLGYREAFPQETTVARVVANDPRAEFKSMTIDKGSTDGIRPLMPVIGPKGLVGKVGSVGSYDARVLLITDPNSAVDALVQRSRARGMVVGTAWRTELKSGHYITRLEYIRRVSDIRDGDVVVTSGFDRIFPPGIPVGTVRDIATSRYGVFTNANVVPFENMPELQEVLVIMSGAELVRMDEGAEG